MSAFHIEKYTPEHKNQWDDFIKTSKNGTFLFQRGFMDYHEERFTDYSLMIYRKDKLIAVFPANRDGDNVYSHQGLTYGGLVLSPKIKFNVVLNAFQSLLEFLAEKTVKTLELKPVPRIYHRYPSDEMDYLLFLVKAKPVRRKLAVAIYNPNPLKMEYLRRRGVKKAKKEGLRIQKETDFAPFWQEILLPNLERQYGVKPVHGAEEIALLANRFPKNIHQYNVYHQGKIVGGTTLFETETAVHTQYISADENRQQLGTLDFLFQHLIDEFAEKTYFDFGTSNENQGKNVNQGLLYWKEGFGARSCVYDTYEINPKNHGLLDDVLI